MIAVLLGVLVVVAAVTIASGAPAPPAPSITSGPLNPTSVTSASFNYSDTQVGATFRCRLDSAPFAVCPGTTSGSISYPGSLALGSHTFQVQAVAGGKTSLATSFTWLITGPLNAPSISSGPSSASFVSSTSATFAFSSSQSGVAGFQCKLDGSSFVSCSSPRLYSGLAQGPRTFQVRAVDALGNPGSAATRSWTVDTVSPPAPVLVIFPDDPNGDGIADFTWTVTPAESPLTFTCQVENLAFEACTSPFHKIVDVSNNQQHQFVVRAYDAAGNYGETSYMWKVLQSVRLTITGDPVGLLYPGAPAVGIDVVLHNPNNFPVYVNALDVTVVGSPGCVAGNFEIVPVADIDATPAKRVLVPTNGTVHVPDGQRPKIRMKNLPVAQNDQLSPDYNCANKQVSLDFYSGSVTK